MHGSSNFAGSGGFQGQGDRGFDGQPFDNSFGGRFARGFGRGPGAHMWEAVDQLRSAFERRGTPRMGRGDVRAAVLALLAERPILSLGDPVAMQQRDDLASNDAAPVAIVDILWGCADLELGKLVQPVNAAGLAGLPFGFYQYRQTVLERQCL